MVVIALCHTSSSEAGADTLEQLNDDGRMFVVRNWDITSQGAAEAAQREVSFFNICFPHSFSSSSGVVLLLENNTN